MNYQYCESYEDGPTRHSRVKTAVADGSTNVKEFYGKAELEHEVKVQNPLTHPLVVAWLDAVGCSKGVSYQYCDGYEDAKEKLDILHKKSHNSARLYRTEEVKYADLGYLAGREVQDRIQREEYEKQNKADECEYERLKAKLRK